MKTWKHRCGIQVEASEPVAYRLVLLLLSPKADTHSTLCRTSPWLTPCRYSLPVEDSPQTSLASFQLCLVLPPPSSSSCTCILLSTFLSPDLLSKYSLVALFLCGLVVSTVTPVWWCCHHFFLTFVPDSSISFFVFGPALAPDQFFR